MELNATQFQHCVGHVGPYRIVDLSKVIDPHTGDLGEIWGDLGEIWGQSALSH